MGLNWMRVLEVFRRMRIPEQGDEELSMPLELGFVYS